VNESQSRGMIPADITAYDVIAFVRRHIRIFTYVPLSFVLLSGVLSFVVHERFRATCVIVPPKQNTDASALLLGQLGGIGGMAASAGGLKLKDPSDFYIGLMKSRSVADSLIRKFGLLNYYQAENNTLARKLLEDATQIKSLKEGMITITVEDTSKRMAMNLANSYVVEMRKVMKKDAAEEAQARLAFFEQQLDEARRYLAKSEDSLRTFLQTHRIVSIEGATGVNVQAGAQIQAQISAREILLQGISSSFSAENPEYKRISSELAALRRQYKDLTSGSPSASMGNVKMAAAEIDYYRLLREAKYREFLFEAIGKQYEIARMDELKQVAHVQVVDPAIEPDMRHSPKRRIWITVGLFLGVVASAIVAVSFEIRTSLKAYRSES